MNACGPFCGWCGFCTTGPRPEVPEPPQSCGWCGSTDIHVSIAGVGVFCSRAHATLAEERYAARYDRRRA